jgi:hypothetical protein
VENGRENIVTEDISLPIVIETGVNIIIKEMLQMIYPTNLMTKSLLNPMAHGISLAAHRINFIFGLFSSLNFSMEKIPVKASDNAPHKETVLRREIKEFRPKPKEEDVLQTLIAVLKDENVASSIVKKIYEDVCSS